MRRSPTLALIVGVLVTTVACGTDSSDDSSSGATTAADTAPSRSRAGGVGSPAPEFDCAALRESLRQLGPSTVQVLAQLDSEEQWDQVAIGNPPLDLQSFRRGLDGLRPLEVLPKSGLRLTAALDTYSSAAALAEQALQSTEPSRSKAGKRLARAVKDEKAFVFHQANIGIAFDEAECTTA